MLHKSPTSSLNKATALKLLITYFNSIKPMSKEFEQELERYIFCIEVDKSTYLTKPSTEKRFIYYIVKGVVRSFTKSNDKEITTWINTENNIVSSIKDLGINVQTNEYLQTLEKCVLIAFPAEMLPILYNQYEEANFYGRKIIEECYRSSEERSYISRIPSAINRYHHFESVNAGLLNRIPLKYIASFLGITIESLCRLRSKRKDHSIADKNNSIKKAS